MDYKRKAITRQNQQQRGAENAAIGSIIRTRKEIIFPT
jgi:hypothetical protein